MKIPTLKEAFFLTGDPHVFEKFNNAARIMIEKGFSAEDFMEEEAGDIDAEALIGAVKRYAGEDISQLKKQDLIDFLTLMGNAAIGLER